MALYILQFSRRHVLQIAAIAVLAAPLITVVGARSSAAAQQSSSETADPAVQEALKQGREALNAKRYEDAEKAFRKANKAAHNKCSECFLGLAQAQESRGDLDAAVSSATKAIDAAADDTSRAEGHVLRGDLLVALGREGKKWNEKKLAEAQADYKSAIDLAPKVAHYHLRMALVLFKQMHDADGKAEVDRYLQLSPNGQYAEFARQLRENPRRAREDYAPDFSVTTLQGQNVKLSGLAGRFVVLDFWATWCPPCRASVGEMRVLAKKYPSDRVVILSVSDDADENKWREFVAAKKMDWLQYRDAGHRLGTLFGVRAIPYYVVIDPDGFIREHIVGSNPQQTIMYRLKEVLGAAMNEPQPARVAGP